LGRAAAIPPTRRGALAPIPLTAAVASNGLALKAAAATAAAAVLIAASRADRPPSDPRPPTPAGVRPPDTLPAWRHAVGPRRRLHPRRTLLPLGPPDGRQALVALTNATAAPPTPPTVRAVHGAARRRRRRDVDAPGRDPTAAAACASLGSGGGSPGPGAQQVGRAQVAAVAAAAAAAVLVAARRAAGCRGARRGSTVLGAGRGRDGTLSPALTARQPHASGTRHTGGTVVASWASGGGRSLPGAVDSGGASRRREPAQPRYNAWRCTPAQARPTPRWPRGGGRATGRRRRLRSPRAGSTATAAALD